MDTWIQLSEFVVSALFRDGVGNEAPLDHLDQLIWTTLNSDTESQTDSRHRRLWNSRLRFVPVIPE